LSKNALQSFIPTAFCLIPALVWRGFYTHRLHY